MDLTKYIKIYVTPMNASEFMGHELTVQNFSEEDGKYGTTVVAKLYDNNLDRNIYVRLNSTTLKDLIDQGNSNTEALIGMKATLKYIHRGNRTYVGIQVKGGENQ